jgi:predicted ATPase
MLGLFSSCALFSHKPAGHISVKAVSWELVKKYAEPEAGLAELLRLRGEYLLMGRQRDAPEAESCFRTAIELARCRSAKSWELRATTSLARHLRDIGRRDEARAMLAGIYNWFTEGFDTADLKQAKALLDEMSF